MTKNVLLSAVIVRNEYGAVATIRFSNPRTDRIISTPNHKKIYDMIEDIVKDNTNG